jgi:hypothetical protein
MGSDDGVFVLLRQLAIGIVMTGLAAFDDASDEALSRSIPGRNVGFPLSAPRGTLDSVCIRRRSTAR